MLRPNLLPTTPRHTSQWLWRDGVMGTGASAERHFFFLHAGRNGTCDAVHANALLGKACRVCWSWGRVVWRDCIFVEGEPLPTERPHFACFCSCPLRAATMLDTLPAKNCWDIEWTDFWRALDLDILGSWRSLFSEGVGSRALHMVSIDGVKQFWRGRRQGFRMFTFVARKKVGAPRIPSRTTRTTKATVLIWTAPWPPSILSVQCSWAWLHRCRNRWEWMSDAHRETGTRKPTTSPAGSRRPSTQPSKCGLDVFSWLVPPQLLAAGAEFHTWNEKWDSGWKEGIAGRRGRREDKLRFREQRVTGGFLGLAELVCLQDTSSWNLDREVAVNLLTIPLSTCWCSTAVCGPSGARSADRHGDRKTEREVNNERKRRQTTRVEEQTRKRKGKRELLLLPLPSNIHWEHFARFAEDSLVHGMRACRHLIWWRQEQALWANTKFGGVHPAVAAAVCCCFWTQERPRSSVVL